MSSINLLVDRLSADDHVEVVASDAFWWMPAGARRTVLVRANARNLQERLDGLAAEEHGQPWGPALSTDEVAWRLLVTHLEETYWELPEGHEEIIVEGDSLRIA